MGQNYYVPTECCQGPQTNSLRLEVLIQNKKRVATLGTDSPCSLINMKIFKKLNLKPRPTTSTIDSPTGQAKIIGKCNVVVQVGKSQKAIKFYIFDNAGYFPDSVLLGQDALAKFQLDIYPDAKVVKIGTEVIPLMKK